MTIYQQTIDKIKHVEKLIETLEEVKRELQSQKEELYIQKQEIEDEYAGKL